MNDQQDAQNNEFEVYDPVLPYTRHASMLDGVIRCADCNELLVGAIDANGIGFYVHEHEIELPGAIR